MSQLPNNSSSHNEERKENEHDNIFSDSLRSRTPIQNRCHHIYNDFTFCNRRRMTTQRVCLQHYNELMIQTRNLNENQNAPMAVDESEETNMNVEEENETIPIVEENVEEQPSNISELENLLSIRPLRLPSILHRESDVSVDNNESIDELLTLPPLEEVLEVPPPLVRQDAVVFESNNVLDQMLSNIIPLSRRIPQSLDDIIRRRAVSSRYRRRVSQPVLVEENPEYDYCLLCENFVVKPCVELRCKHKYHLNCFIIDNSNEKHQIELKEKCNKCDKKIIYEQEEYDCSICLEKIIDHKILSNLPCEHKFHLHCIEQWRVMNKNTCPLCRTEF